MKAGGDVNKDGISDIVIGSQSAAFVILGRDTIDRSKCCGIYRLILHLY